MEKSSSIAKHTVIITVEDGVFSYSLPSFDAKRGDEVEWKCRYPFAIHIGWESPLSEERYQAGPGQTIGAQILPDAPYGRFKYLVAVWDGKNVWTDDPEFIVRR